MIFHIVGKTAWRDAVHRGVYTPESLEHDGFIHASTRDQTLGTANGFFRAVPDLVLLCIDARRLQPEVRMEPPAEAADTRSDERFPHIYGPLNLDAVVDVREFPCESDGSFRWPD